MNKRYAAFALIALALVAAGAAHAQTLVITPNPISFYAQVGTSSSASQTVTVKSSDNTTAIPFTVSPGNSWINPISGTPAGGWVTPATFSVSVNPSQLQLGTTTGSMIVSGVAGSGLFVAVPVNVTMSTISVGLPGGQTSSLSLGTYAAGSPVYPSPVSALTVSGDTTNLTVTKGSVDNWYTFQVFGTPPSAVQVSFNAAVAASLTPGTLTGTLTLTPEGANPVPVKITITLTVTQSPQVTVNPASLVFNWQRSGANQTQQFFTLNSNSPQAVSVSLSTPGVSWITLPVSNPTIPANGSVQVAVQVAQAAGDAQPAGANNGSIQISIPGGGALFPNGTTSLSFPITLNVSNYPMLYVPASLLSYTYQFGSTTTPAPQVLVPIGTSSGTPVNFTVASSTASWLSIQPPPGSLLNTPSSFTVSVNPAGLAPGTYTSSVTVIPGANGSGQGTITIPVVLTVTFQNSLLTSLPTNTLVFPYQVGQSTPASQTVNLSSYTGAPLNYTVTPPAATAAWVQVTGPLSGTTDNTSFTVSINPSGIPAQPWPPYLDATINIAATDPSTQSPVNSVSVDVRLYVSTAAQLVVTPPGPVQLSFYPNSPYYPSSNQAILSLASTLPVTSELNITSIQRTGVAPGATSPWIGGLDSGPLTPTSLTVNGTVLYSASMLPGTYNGSVSISATGGLSATPVADSGISIPVQFTVNRALGSVTWPKAADGSMSFTQTKGGQVPAAQVVQVGTDSISLPFDVVVNTGLYNWLTISGITSNTPGSFNVSVDASNLAIGTWRGAIYVDMPNAAGSPFRIPVTFYVNGGAICAGSCSSPTQSLSFTQIVGGATPAAQPVAIVSTPSSATYTISAATTTPPNGNWLLASISAGGGITPGTVTVSVNPGSLAAGTYNGTVTITSPGATGSPIVIQVTLTVQQASITASTTPLVFNQLAGGPAPAAQQVVVTFDSLRRPVRRRRHHGQRRSLDHRHCRRFRNLRNYRNRVRHGSNLRQRRLAFAGAVHRTGHHHLGRGRRQPHQHTGAADRGAGGAARRKPIDAHVRRQRRPGYHAADGSIDLDRQHHVHRHHGHQG